MSEPALVPILKSRLPLLANVRPISDGPPDPADIAAFDAFGAPVEGYRAPEVSTRDTTIGGPHGDIPIRIYQPDGVASRGLVWAHGGAFMMGDLDAPEADSVGRELAARHGVAVVSVDYRLCLGGVHFPVPHDDVHAAFLWAANESGLVPDGAGWSVGGGSAGGNLAAGVGQRLRDEGGVQAEALLLGYPVLHFDLPEPSPEHAARAASLPSGLGFPEQARTMINRNFLGENPPEVPYAFAALGDVKDLPPTFLSLADHDDLTPSGEAFAELLRSAGVTVEVEFVKGVIHGHLNVAGLPEAMATIDAMAAFMASAGS